MAGVKDESRVRPPLAGQAEAAGREAPAEGRTEMPHVRLSAPKIRMLFSAGILKEIIFRLKISQMRSAK